MARHEQLYAGADGWSPWRWPIHKGYRMTCCGCGLVHDMEVMVHKAKKQSLDGVQIEVFNKPAKGYRIRWRWRVNNRATAQVRRHMKAEDRI